MRCTYGDCPRVFLTFQRLKDHALRQHGAQQLSEFATCVAPDHVANCNPTEQPDMHLSTDNEEMELVTTNDSSGINLQQSFMRFISNMGSKPGMSQVMLQTVTEEMYNFVSDISDCAVKTVNMVCAELNVAPDDIRVASAVQQLRHIPKFMSEVGTTYKRNKWLKDNGFFIEPLEVVLGTRLGQKYSTFLRRSRAVTVEDTFQYIPLDQLLAKFLEDPDAVRLMNENHGVAKGSRIHDFIDTSTYKNHDLLIRHPNAFMLHFFIDAYETVNVLGSHTTVHKMEALYCMIRNFPSKYLSKTSNIFLLGLWYSLDVKRYGYEKILSPVFQHLKQLESEDGLTGLVFGNAVAMHGVLIAFSADNLGAHALFGFLESFSANHPCRFCLADKTGIQEKFLEKLFTMRTPENYDDCVKRCKTATYNASDSGIKDGCIFNNLRFFHCTEQSVPDCMHDICEGVAPFEIKLVLKSLIDSQVVTLDHINHCIREFSYSLSDKNSKPPEVTLPNLRLQAAECWCLIRNLPLMIGQKVPRGNPHWQLLIKLLDCMFIIFAPEVTESMADYLMLLVEEHHALFKTLYSDVSLLPKHHFMIHYGSVMKRLGPLIRYWCMRFEAKHRFGKELSSVCRNFKNICKTIAWRNQYRLASDFLNHSSFRMSDIIGPSKPVLVRSFDDIIAQAIISSFALHKEDEVYVASSCYIGHYSFKPGCLIAHSVVDGTPQFAEVQHIIRFEEKTQFVCICYRTDGFDEHFYAFEVSKLPLVCLVPANSLADFHPLAVHQIYVDGQAKLFINIRAKLF